VYAGVPATFIRLQGCNVGCSWCDTKYTWGKGGEKMSSSAIVSMIKHNHVVVTGGEPTIWNLDMLLTTIRNKNPKAFVQLETSGQHSLKGRLLPSWITWSPKAALNFTLAEGLRNKVDEIKIVVDEDLTADYVSSILVHAAPKVHIVFMPEGTPPTSEIVSKAIEYTLHYANAGMVRFSDRLHLRLDMP